MCFVFCISDMFLYTSELTGLWYHPFGIDLQSSLPSVSSFLWCRHIMFCCCPLLKNNFNNMSESMQWKQSWLVGSLSNHCKAWPVNHLMTSLILSSIHMTSMRGRVVSYYTFYWSVPCPLCRSSSWKVIICWWSFRPSNPKNKFSTYHIRNLSASFSQ